MNIKKNFQSFAEASEVLGDDFWDVISDVLPFIGPRIDIVRTSREVIVIAELAGLVSKEQISVHVQGMVLNIEGNIQRPYTEAPFQVIQDERFHGTFKRKIRLPNDCIIEKMSASYINGLLQIVIPTYSSEEKYEKQKIDVQFIHQNIPLFGGGHHDKN